MGKQFSVFQSNQLFHIIVGTTGHRDLRLEDKQFLKEKVQFLFREYFLNIQKLLWLSFQCLHSSFSLKCSLLILFYNLWLPHIR